ncbi:MAG: sulfite exporter TauE/SafE family protein [Acidimicrobiales bacterium]
MELTLVAVVAAAIATLVGATIQGSIGFGMNLVTVPVLALVLPETLPAAVIVLGIPVSITMLRHEWASLDRTGLGWIIGGRLPGTALGAWIVATVATSTLQAVIGSMILLVVLASIAAPPVPVRPGTQAVTGAVSGITGTAGGIGGPPLALLYQYSSGPTIRATLSASFLIGTFVSLFALGITGSLTVGQLGLGAGLAPLVVAGVVIGRRSHSVLDRGWMRPAVLAFAAVSAAVVIIDAAV